MHKIERTIVIISSDSIDREIDIKSKLYDYFCFQANNMGSSQQFSLRWNNYLKHITCAFDTLRTDEDLVDVTLSCEGKKIRAHKMLLSACSTYFRDLFKVKTKHNFMFIIYAFKNYPLYICDCCVTGKSVPASHNYIQKCKI